MKKLNIIFASLMFWLICSPALAISYYNNEADFQNNAGSIAFDSFEELTAFTLQPVESIQRSGYSITSGIFNPPIPQGDAYGLYVFGHTAGFGAFATDGTHYLVHQSETNESLIFNFAAPIQSFGLSFTDWESPTGSDATLVFRNNLGDEFTVAMTPLDSANQFFFGVTSDTAFTSVEFINSSPSEAYGVDGVYISSSVVPLPGALVLMLGALVSLSGWRLRLPDDIDQGVAGLCS